jgi:hypothetical protein
VLLSRLVRPKSVKSPQGHDASATCPPSPYLPSIAHDSTAQEPLNKLRQLCHGIQRVNYWIKLHSNSTINVLRHPATKYAAALLFCSSVTAWEPCARDEVTESVEIFIHEYQVDMIWVVLKPYCTSRAPAPRLGHDIDWEAVTTLSVVVTVVTVEGCMQPSTLGSLADFKPNTSQQLEGWKACQAVSGDTPVGLCWDVCCSSGRQGFTTPHASRHS